MSTRRDTAFPVIVLFLLSPLIGEIVTASLRFSYFAQLPRAVGILCFYGAGVVLIRETVQRLGLTRWGLLLLGAAYAVLEEGLGLQTIFNPAKPTAAHQPARQHPPEHFLVGMSTASHGMGGIDHGS